MAAASNKPWSNSEDFELRSHYGFEPVSATADRLGRSRADVGNRASFLSLDPYRPVKPAPVVARVREAYFVRHHSLVRVCLEFDMNLFKVLECLGISRDEVNADVFEEAVEILRIVADRGKPRVNCVDRNFHSDDESEFDDAYYEACEEEVGEYAEEKGGHASQEV